MAEEKERQEVVTSDGKYRVLFLGGEALKQREYGYYANFRREFKGREA